MKKIVTLFATVLLLYGCGSVPLTGRKQMLLVSDSEVLSSSLPLYFRHLCREMRPHGANFSQSNLGSV